MESDVSRSKGGVIGCRASVFARSEEKVKGDGDEISNGLAVGSGVEEGVKSWWRMKIIIMIGTGFTREGGASSFR
jgi:hypothetical protein